MYCIADVFDGWQYDENLYGTNIVRPFLVYGVPTYNTTVGNVTTIGNSGNASTDIFSCPGLPQIYDPHPVLNYCLCTDRRIRYRGSSTSFFVDCIYKSSLNSVNAVSGGNVPWVVTDTPQISQVSVSATADSSVPLAAFYTQQPGTGNVGVNVNGTYPSGGNGVFAGWSIVGGNITTPPTSSRIPGTCWDNVAARSAPKLICKRTINVRGAFLGTAWKAFQPYVDACRGKINQAPWGPGSKGGTISSACNPRGYWFFAGAQTTSNDMGQTYIVDMNFFGDDKLWFVLLNYTNDTGFYISSASTEAQIRAWPTPAVGKCTFGNGLTLASIYSEADFSIFTF